MKKEEISVLYLPAVDFLRFFIEPTVALMAGRGYFSALYRFDDTAALFLQMSAGGELTFCDMLREFAEAELQLILFYCKAELAVKGGKAGSVRYPSSAG